MGCLKNIVTIIVLTFAVIGFVKVGAWDWCKKMYEERQGKEATVGQATQLLVFGNY